jgi:hypothetical protein
MESLDPLVRLREWRDTISWIHNRTTASPLGTATIPLRQVPGGAGHRGGARREIPDRCADA